MSTQTITTSPARVVAAAVFALSAAFVPSSVQAQAPTVLPASSHQAAAKDTTKKKTPTHTVVAPAASVRKNRAKHEVKKADTTKTDSTKKKTVRKPRRPDQGR